MKKYFKKFSMIFMVAFAIMLGNGISAFADDSYLVGTSNLNNTVANSAAEGVQLTSPEKGWKRYDDHNSIVTYNNMVQGSKAPNYDGEFSYSTTKGEFAKFNFTGSKIRIIGPKYSVYSKNITIKIDGISYTRSEYTNTDIIYQTIIFEEKNLTDTEHSVEIIGNDTDYDVLDAIDIDTNGQLLPYNESISLDKSTMDVNVGDSQQLTSTTTPASVGVTWTSSDESIATVDSTGKVMGAKEGQATITATTVDGLTATCAVNVIKKDDPQPSNPDGGTTTGDANLYIELVDGQIKQYSVSQDEISKFTTWYENRDKDHSLSATYKFAKGTYTDYVVHDQIDWFKVR